MRFVLIFGGFQGRSPSHASMDVVGELWNQRLAPLLAQLSQSCEYSDSRSLQSKSLHPHIRRVSRYHPLSCEHESLILWNSVIINIQHKWILCKRKCGFYVFFWWIVKLYLRKWVHRCIINMHLHKRCMFMQNIHWIMHKRKWRTYLWRK